MHDTVAPFLSDFYTGKCLRLSHGFTLSPTLWFYLNEPFLKLFFFM